MPRKNHLQETIKSPRNRTPSFLFALFLFAPLSLLRLCTCSPVACSSQRLDFSGLSVFPFAASSVFQHVKLRTITRRARNPKSRYAAAMSAVVIARHVCDDSCFSNRERVVMNNQGGLKNIGITQEIRDKSCNEAFGRTTQDISQSNIAHCVMRSGLIRLTGKAVQRNNRTFLVARYPTARLTIYASADTQHLRL